MLVFVGIMLFVLLVILHEYGHFLAAKLNDVEVEEFGVGFPPRITGKIFGRGIFKSFYTLNWLPLGGFVKLKGEHDADRAKGSYGSVSFGRKALILLAGVGMNLIAAAVIFTGLSWSGMPHMVDGQFTVASDTNVKQQTVLVNYVRPDSPADKSGLAAGDQLISIAGHALGSADEVSDLTEANAGRIVSVVFDRDGLAGNDHADTTVDVQLDPLDATEGYLGVVPSEYTVETSTWSAPIKGIGLTAQYSWLTLAGIATTIKDAVSGQGAAAAENIAGPVGIVVLFSEIGQAGIGPLMVFIGLLSVALAVFNILPIPALDGGRLFVTALFRALKKPLSQQKEEQIQAVGMTVLMLLVIVITVLDVRRFF